jgi:adenylosuccinate synthase
MALTSFKSKLIADVGISMGDEGKGRLIPEIVRELQALTGRRDVVGTVLKVNGGANSGHTVAGLKLNLLPGGVAEHDVACLALGAGVVADPRKALWEALPLEKIGIPVLKRLLIDERCMISDVSHRILDLAWEDYRVNVLGHEARGSTGRGITPGLCRRGRPVPDPLLRVPRREGRLRRSASRPA